MNCYERWILPRVLDWSMRLKLTIPYRERAAARARGVVLEVGIGSGLNLPFYTSGVERVVGVDPSPELLRITGPRAKSAPFPVELLCGSGEALPLEKGSIDTVVMTWTLCSIPDVARALSEMRRVLKPGGGLLFVEHGRAPDAGVVRWQDRLTPVWKCFSGGCHLNREPDKLMRAAGFRVDDLHAEYAPGPRVITYCYEGRATR